jgi:prepilin-type N-terminal cleavage/methylation domain-containing protein
MPMSPVSTLHTRLRNKDGFTLIELLIAMALGLIVSLAAFSILEFTTSDVSRITNRAHVDQTGRVALEKIMLQLHSACVAVTITPIEPKSNENTIKFVSETSPLNSKQEPISSLSTVKLHEITYNKATGTLTEKSRPSVGTNPLFKFNEHETPEPTVHTLLTGIKQTEVINETTHLPEIIPIFQYYRYYVSSDTKVKLGEAKLGELDPERMSDSTMAIEKSPTETEAEKVAKVTISFTLTPEGKEGAFAKGDQPVALEDSAIFRFTPSSEEAGNTNLPCAQI